MITVSSMQSITLPIFGSATNNGQASHSAPSTSWGGSDSGAPDGLDFDLLAEYLLDDGAALNGFTGGMPNFDFK